MISFELGKITAYINDISWKGVVVARNGKILLRGCFSCLYNLQAILKLLIFIPAV